MSELEARGHMSATEWRSPSGELLPAGAGFEGGLEVLEAKLDRLRRRADGAAGALLGVLAGLLGGEAGLLGLAGGFGRLGGGDRSALGADALTLCLYGAAALGLALLSDAGGFEARLLSGGELRVARAVVLLGLLEQCLLGLGLGFQPVGEGVFVLQACPLLLFYYATIRPPGRPASWPACDPRD